LGDFLLDGIRRMTPGQRMSEAFRLSEMVRSMAESEMRQRNPNATDGEIFLRMARLAL
jgi:hypothetical protein